MALCKAVIPSSLAAEGLVTSIAVLLTSSNSPSKDASRRSAKGSKLTLLGTLEEFLVFRFPFFIRRITTPPLLLLLFPLFPLVPLLLPPPFVLLLLLLLVLLLSMLMLESVLVVVVRLVVEDDLLVLFSPSLSVE